jgi:hypothetical protein
MTSAPERPRRPQTVPIADNGSGHEVDEDALTDALENTAHGLSGEAWAAWLISQLPDVFLVPPLPRGPITWPVSLDERLEIMATRVAAGYGHTHPMDSWVGNGGMDAGGHVLRNGRNGAAYEGESCDYG